MDYNNALSVLYKSITDQPISEYEAKAFTDDSRSLGRLLAHTLDPPSDRVAGFFMQNTDASIKQSILNGAKKRLLARGQTNFTSNELNNEVVSIFNEFKDNLIKNK